MTVTMTTTKTATTIARVVTIGISHLPAYPRSSQQYFQQQHARLLAHSPAASVSVATSRAVDALVDNDRLALATASALRRARGGDSDRDNVDSLDGDCLPPPARHSDCILCSTNVPNSLSKNLRLHTPHTIQSAGRADRSNDALVSSPADE